MIQKFNFVSVLIDGLYIVERNSIKDERGSFCRFFCAEEFSRIGFNKSIVQINHSLTNKKGTVRGFHFQKTPYTETKIVSCLKGSVFDVAVDIRMDSPTFLQWHAEELSENNNKSMYIPDGFAHGFQTLEDNCELLYLHSEFYTPSAEDSINVLDSKISMEWPLNITQISKRDSAQPMIDINIFKGVKVV